MKYILAIDLGTTSTRAVLFDDNIKPIAIHEIEIKQIYPANGWVEHDPEQIWQATLDCCRAVASLVAANNIKAIGITNQRETTVLWERQTGKALHNAIVWQDRRTAPRCRELIAAGYEQQVSETTGLLLDSYFSATKAEWLLDHIPGSRARAARGELALGTLDSYLIFKLTGGKIHATDVTNASRTMLLNLKSLTWDDTMLELFNVPRELLPEVRACTDDFGTTSTALLGAAIPIRGVAGDQHAALFGQSCYSPGDIKVTYGTGCFVLVNTGNAPAKSTNRLLITCGYRAQNHTAYAIEGSIFIAGAVVQWLRDALGVIHSSADIEVLATTAKPAEGLYFIPAFTGLGAPYWDPDARGAILGLTRDMGAAEIARAALDAVCFQTRDLLKALTRDMNDANLPQPQSLKVDGGMVRNNWFCQRLADLTGLSILRPNVIETTALGAAYLAGLQVGLIKDMSILEKSWTLDRRFEPSIPSSTRDTLYDGWNKAVARIRTAN